MGHVCESSDTCRHRPLGLLLAQETCCELWECPIDLPNREVTVPLGSAPLFVTVFSSWEQLSLQEEIRPSGVLGKVGLGHTGCSSVWETHFSEYESNPPLSNTDNPLPANQSSRHQVSIYGLSIYGRDAQTHFLLPCLSRSIPSLVYPFLSLPSLLSFPLLFVCLLLSHSLFLRYDSASMYLVHTVKGADD